MEEKINNIKEKILNFIHKDEVKMKPRGYFIFKSILQIVSVFLVFIATLYLASFISLILKEKEVFKTFGIRPNELSHFIYAVPWMIVFLSLVLLVVLEILTRKFAFVYKKPVAYSLFAIIILVLSIGFLLNKIDREFRFARFGEGKAPILGPMHKYYRGEFEERPFVKKFYKFQDRRIKDPNFDFDEFRDLPPPHSEIRFSPN